MKPNRSMPPSAVIPELGYDDVGAHHAHAVARGTQVISPPEDHFYGERQYSVVDPGGHSWTFSESIADVAPENWGGTSVDLG